MNLIPGDQNAGGRNELLLQVCWHQEAVELACHSMKFGKMSERTVISWKFIYLFKPIVMLGSKEQWLDYHIVKI